MRLRPQVFHLTHPPKEILSTQIIYSRCFPNLHLRLKKTRPTRGRMSSTFQDQRNTAIRFSYLLGKTSISDNQDGCRVDSCGLLLLRDVRHARWPEEGQDERPDEERAPRSFPHWRQRGGPPECVFFHSLFLFGPSPDCCQSSRRQLAVKAEEKYPSLKTARVECCYGRPQKLLQSN